MTRVRVSFTVCTVLVLVAAAGGQMPPGPPVQQAYMKGSHAGVVPDFGRSVALSGDTLLVGAPWQTTGGPPGSVYCFVRESSGWVEQAWILPANPVTDMEFGYSVSLSGDTAVVGAPFDQVGGKDAGAAHVLVRSGDTWTEQAVLTASNPDSQDLFGWSVAISGDTIVVGAPVEDSPATGVNGSQGNGKSGTGAAYVFVRSGTTWSQQAYVKASNTDGGDKFGEAVAIDGDTIVAGAQWEQSASPGVNGNQADNSIHGAGAAYVFTRSGTEWTQQAYLKASNPGNSDYFGQRLAVAGDTLVVGAPGEDSAATGQDGNQSDNSLPSAGAVYVFTRSGASWAQQAYLKSSNSSKSDFFGVGLGLSGDLLLVGASGEASAASGVGGDQASNGLAYAGAAYLFRRAGPTWNQIAYIKPSYSTLSEAFGWDVALSGSLCAVAANGEKGLSQGINGDQTNIALAGVLATGAVYAFDLDPGPWTDLSFGLAGSAGTPTLVGSGPLTDGSNNSLKLAGAVPSANTVLFVGLAPLVKFFKQGTCVPLPVAFVMRNTDALGGWQLGFPWPAGIPAGTVMYLQCWVSDPGGPAGFSASNAIEGVAH